MTLGNPRTFGLKPKSNKEKGECEKDRWKAIIKSAEEGTTKEEYPDIYFRYNGTVNRLCRKQFEPLSETCGIWYHGPSGSGKSKSARSNFPGLYDKLLNKWWDNYDGEDVVLLDDLDHFHAPQMGSALKRYADHYPFRAEVKNSSMLIRPKIIVVTSQYTIEELWPEIELQTALLRRFKVTHFRKL